MEFYALKLLLLSFYYPPDIGPGALRAKAIVDALVSAGGKGLEIEVLTTQPNRYHSTNYLANKVERFPGVIVTRFSLPELRNGYIDQASAFYSFTRQALRNTKGKEWDIVIATSGRLMTAFLGAWISRRTRTPLYLDIRDLFIDTIGDIFKKSPMRALIPVFKILEIFTFSTASKINVVSAGFLPYVRRLAPSAVLSEYTNGIDDEFLSVDFTRKETDPKGPPQVLYAGNIGDGQGLHRVIPEVAMRMAGQIDFLLVGDGGKRRELRYELDRREIKNVRLLDPVPRHELFEHYRNSDILFLHLNDFQAFRKVLPSKIFEYAATGKPILAGVGGYAAEFLAEQVPGVEIFEPCNYIAMQQSLLRILRGPRLFCRRDFCARYLRKSIMTKMATEITGL